MDSVSTVSIVITTLIVIAFSFVLFHNPNKLRNSKYVISEMGKACKSGHASFNIILNL